MEYQNQEIVIHCYENFNRGEIDTALMAFAKDASNHGFKVGCEGFKFVLEDIYRTFPDCRFEILEMTAGDDNVVVRTLRRGTHLGVGQVPVNGGMLVGVKPTGKTFEVQHIHWYKLRDGKIIEHYACRDDIGMMQQLGLLPPVLA